MNTEQTLILAKILRSGILNQINQNRNILKQLQDYANKYQVYDKDDKINYIFKSFVINGNNRELMKDYKTFYANNKYISDVLFFRQSSDIELTLLAKAIYAVSGTPYKDFLLRQVEILSQNNIIDIKHEYIIWRRELGDSEDFIQRLVSEVENGVGFN